MLYDVILLTIATLIDRQTYPSLTPERKDLTFGSIIKFNIILYQSLLIIFISLQCQSDQSSRDRLAINRRMTE